MRSHFLLCTFTLWFCGALYNSIFSIVAISYKNIAKVGFSALHLHLCISCFRTSPNRLTILVGFVTKLLSITIGRVDCITIPYLVDMCFAHPFHSLFTTLQYSIMCSILSISPQKITIVISS